MRADGLTLPDGRLGAAEASGDAPLTIAIAKGRMQDRSLSLLGAAGIQVDPELLKSRRLTVADREGAVRFVFVKPADVPVYVEHGIADCGVVGRDVLLESGADLLQPLDLKIAGCRIAVAALSTRPISDLGVVRVATKYPRIALAHFGARGIPVEIIELSGSVELAPVLGLSDCIVDLVETGQTLAENGLEIVEVITESTGRFVVNRASYQLKVETISSLIRALRVVLQDTE
jgi:ATP phosphoribosyltransferase